ncbi:hypothetical protein KXV85_008224 [Aspergillus fumigatus]|nr:hypothetical protein KXV85_008224 [Aspergillus fumigatus]
MDGWLQNESLDGVGLAASLATMLPASHGASLAPSLATMLPASHGASLAACLATMLPDSHAASLAPLLLTMLPAAHSTGLQLTLAPNPFHHPYVPGNPLLVLRGDPLHL